MTKLTLRAKPAVWKQRTLAQRFEDCRILLHIHGYLRDSESNRIKAKLAAQWDKEPEL